MNEERVTYGSLAAEMRRRLEGIYGAGEARAMVRLIFHHLKGWDTTQQIINDTLPASERVIHACADILNRLERQEPLQYILGEARFYGMDLKVSPAVLIPRPETAELVDMIVSGNQRPDLRVLDIGTGSGAIAIALSRNLPFARVTALDVSAQALEIARANARNLHADIRFIHADIFTWQPAGEVFDIVVSNPPYIAESEKESMEPNVLEHEPATALFVPDNDPLMYYRRIADVARESLHGSLYLEINPLYAAPLAEMLGAKGFDDVQTLRDSQGSDRFITAKIHTQE